MHTQQPVCINDFGSEVYLCEYTQELVPAEQTKQLGSIVPGVKMRRFVKNCKDALDKHKESGRLFAESEANCNTCKHLERKQSEKNSAGFLYGYCRNPLLQVKEEPMMFHPDDCMLMQCYESRWV